MAIPLKNGVKISLPQYGKTFNGDVWKIENVYMFVLNPNYVWTVDASTRGWSTDAEVLIGPEEIYRQAEYHGGRFDILIVSAANVTIIGGAF